MKLWGVLMAYVNDAKIILTTMSIRYAVKRDVVRADGRMEYYLELSYKGHEKQVKYDTAHGRDAIFNQIVEQLHKRKPQDVTKG